MTAELSLVGDYARRSDPTRFLCALLAPLAAREAIFALLAFNGELARIQLVVSEPALRLIRLQWWREALEAGDRRSHELLLPLMEAVERHQLSLPLLMAMIEMWEGVTEEQSPLSDAALYRLMLECVDERSPAALAAAEAVGQGYALKNKELLASARMTDLSRAARLVLVSRHVAFQKNKMMRGFLLLLRGLLP